MLPSSSNAKQSVNLSPEQALVIKDVLDGHNVLVTGPAGSGKSTVLNTLRRQLGERLSVTASTGIAALNVDGTTLHTFAGLGIGEDPARIIATRILAGRGKTYDNITNCEILAIDEISMLSGAVFDLADDVFRLVRECDEPFGGVQLLLFGDFLQLPPVSRRVHRGTGQPVSPATFAFESDAWTAAEIRLRFFTQVFRQTDQAFADALGRLRVGDVNHPSISLIASRNNVPLPNDGIRPIIVHTRNIDVDRENHAELDKLSGKEHVCLATDLGEFGAKERLDRDCLAPKELRLKAGAQVMLLANINLDEGLVNGRMGVVTDIKPTAISVRFGKEAPVEISTHKWEIKNNRKVLAERHQFPLRLAYAMTSHKTQGLTLDRILVHLDPDKVFEFGQAYVAVSRAKTLDGLFIRNGKRTVFRPHPKALAFYQNPPKFTSQQEIALG